MQRQRFDCKYLHLLYVTATDHCGHYGRIRPVSGKHCHKIVTKEEALTIGLR
jgi:hypothetical protein